ncbi:MAG: SUMF1/EgtB/PvdO family nonheme iron enzyme [Candidatus Kapabacteria bacterium]|nr:SUMF1/EgtB/PvdO family nonheme iron enzyme [Candidatus Kapabacteria bacterium]
MKNLKILIALLCLISLYSCYNNPQDPDIIIPAKTSAIIDSISPRSCTVDDTITIYGKHFGSRLVFNEYIIFDDSIKSTAYIGVNWSDTKIQIFIPSGLHFDSIKVSIQANDTIGNTYKIKLNKPSTFKEIPEVLIPSGTYQMGDINSTGFSTELPIRNISISRAFFMSTIEITQNLWKYLIPYNPSIYKGDSLPVHDMNWYQAIEFCNKLSEYKKLQKCYSYINDSVVCDWNSNGYRLPTEAEWEYAARAGSSTDYYNGGLDNNLLQIAWYAGNFASYPHTGGLKAANNFGLYDMLGNVSEYCWDYWAVYDTTKTIDPKGPASGSLGRVSRGGAWQSISSSCRVSFRQYYQEPSINFYYAGIRLVRNK